MTTDLTAITPEQREILYNMRGKGVSDNDFMFMMELARKYKLDPFARQIYATSVGIIVSRDGYLSLAHRSGQFNGMNTTYKDDEKGNPVSATTTVWRKDMDHPFEETAYWSEYSKDNEVWRKYKHPMLQKCSERMALSKAFSISGLYAEEEFAQDETYGTPESIECVDAEVIHAPVTVEQIPAEVKTAEEEKKKPSRIYSKEHMDIARNNFKEIFGRELTQEEIDSCRMPDGLYDGDKVMDLFNREK